MDERAEFLSLSRWLTRYIKIAMRCGSMGYKHKASIWIPISLLYYLTIWIMVQVDSITQKSYLKFFIKNALTNLMGEHHEIIPIPISTRC